MRRRFLSIAFPALALLVALGAARGRRAIAAEQAVTLFTEEEASGLRVTGEEWDPVPRARSASPGPAILMRIPEITRIDGSETLLTTTPASVLIEFEENEAPVDMRTLRVIAKKGLFSKSLTDKLTPFVEGTKLAVDAVEVPVGKFQIQIYVEDLEGHETSRTFRLIVED